MLTDDHDFIHGHLHEHQLHAYKGLEEDGDPKEWVEKLCFETKECVQMKAEYDACVERLTANPSPDKHCSFQYMNMWGCVDYCAAEPHFKLLKHGL